MKQFKSLIRSRISFIAAAIMVFFVACNKDKSEPALQSNLDQVVELTHQAYLQTDVVGGDENTPIYLVNDGLVEEYIASESHMMLKQGLIPNRLIRCLLRVELTDEQYTLARRAVNAHEMRNKRLIGQHRNAMADLKGAFEARRTYWIGQFRAGEITAAELRTNMMELRRRFISAVKDLKNSNAEEFRASFKQLLEHFNIILDDEQWISFTTCLRGNLTP